MIFAALFALVVLSDQVTKMMIISSFSLYESMVVVPGFFNLVYVTNPGAAFSMLAEISDPWRHYLFVGVAGTAIIAIVAYNWLSEQRRVFTIALALIGGGAAGNLIDRIRFGAVVDFLDFYLGQYHWPAFNVADSAICIGAALYIGATLFESKINETKENI